MLKKATNIPKYNVTSTPSCYLFFYAISNIYIYCKGAAAAHNFLDSYLNLCYRVHCISLGMVAQEEITKENYVLFTQPTNI